MKAPSTFSVETKILRERLRNTEFKALLHEVVNGPSVVVEITRSESLVGTIEERKMLLRPYDLGKLHPLFPCRIYTGGVVSASVEKDDRALRGRLQSPIETVEVEAFSGRVIIRVCC